MAHKQREAGRRGLGVFFLPLVLLACSLMVIGCESDSVAPDDDPPALTEMEVAQQSGLVAAGISKVGPELLKFSGPKAAPAEEGVYFYEFPPGGDITGTINLEYFSGGPPPAGTHSHWDNADYGFLKTPDGTMVEAVVDLTAEVELAIGMTFDMHGDIDQTADTATVSGGGTITLGSFTNDFTITETDPVVLSGISDYPQGGEFMYSADGIDLLVVYDGDHTADVVIGDIVSYKIDLDTAVVTLVGE